MQDMIASIDVDSRAFTSAVLLGLIAFGALLNGVWAFSKRRNPQLCILLSIFLTPIPVALYLLMRRQHMSEKEYELEKFATDLLFEAEVKDKGGDAPTAVNDETVKRTLPEAKAMPVVLSIAGSDASGGAGIQADLKTCAALGCYGATAITAVTAQNTQGVFDVQPLPAPHLTKQIHAVLDDIGADAIKIGMLANPLLVNAVADVLGRWDVKNVVIDTVLASESGTALLAKEAVRSLTQRLFPMATIVTPNIPEAEILTGITIDGEDTLREAAEALHAMGPKYVLLKGGHLEGPEAIDWLYNGSAWRAYAAPRIDTPNNHGTGCTLATAIAAYLAQGQSIEDAVQQSKDYVTGALRHSLDLGKGSGPLHHQWQQERDRDAG
jgi:hydroxymethylpyrimidine kinase/phosphomethylpyrimidine kinase